MNDVQTVRERLVGSGILSADAVENHVAAWSQQAADANDGDELLAWLVGEKKVGELQADAIGSGHTGPIMLGAYRLLEPLATGRLGKVYRAVQDQFDQKVSIKIFVGGLDESPDVLSQVQRELRVAVRMDHPNVVRTVEVGRVADTYFLAMENLEGETLAARLARDGRLPYDAACRMARDVARALHHLHEQEIIHRDVQPENIWLTEGGGAKLMEFSSAKDPLAYLDEPEDEEQAAYGSSGEEFAGTFGYMAPEQALDPELADVRSDVYSLACVLYEALTGEPPFVSADPVRLMMRHALEIQRSANELVDEVPQAVSDTVNSMLSKDPAERFKSAKDVTWTLEQFFKEEKADQGVQLVNAPDFNPEYLEWCRSKSEASRQQPDLDHSAGITPELVSFLNRMSKKTKKKK